MTKATSDKEKIVHTEQVIQMISKSVTTLFYVSQLLHCYSIVQIRIDKNKEWMLLYYKKAQDIDFLGHNKRNYIVRRWFLSI